MILNSKLRGAACSGGNAAPRLALAGAAHHQSLRCRLNTSSLSPGRLSALVWSLLGAVGPLTGEESPLLQRLGGGVARAFTEPEQEQNFSALLRSSIHHQQIPAQAGGVKVSLA